MTSEKIWQRSDLLGTQVITRDTGKRLGVVSQLWVDVDRREVVAVSLRDNLLSGLLSNIPRYMMLSNVRQIGDVILVENEDVVEDINPEVYNSLINCEVITETGELLGRVRGFRFDVEDGKVNTLIIASIGLPQIPDQIVSTYELPVDEIVSSGPDRLIVFEGAEERLNQLTVGVLERLGIGKAPWEREDDEDYLIPTAPAENQLGTGVRVNVAPTLRTPVRERQEAWSEDDWERSAPPPPKAMRAQRQPEPEPPAYYDDDEEDNWSEATNRDRYRDDYEDEYEDEPVQEAYVAEYEDELEDAWADEPKPYKAPRINIPEKTKVREPEYEEENY